MLVVGSVLEEGGEVLRSSFVLGWQDKTDIFYYYNSNKERLFLYFAPQMALLGFFILPLYAATGNQTHLSLVAPPRGTLIQDALPTELPWRGYETDIYDVH